MAKRGWIPGLKIRRVDIGGRRNFDCEAVLFSRTVLHKDMVFDVYPTEYRQPLHSYIIVLSLNVYSHARRPDTETPR